MAWDLRRRKESFHAISGRRALGANLADAIVATDDADVIHHASVEQECADPRRDVGQDRRQRRRSGRLAPTFGGPVFSLGAARKNLGPDVTDAISEGVRRRLGDAGVDSDDDEPASEKVRRLFAE